MMMMMMMMIIIIMIIAVHTSGTELHSASKRHM